MKENTSCEYPSLFYTTCIISPISRSVSVLALVSVYQRPIMFVSRPQVLCDTFWSMSYQNIVIQYSRLFIKKIGRLYYGNLLYIHIKLKRCNNKLTYCSVHFTSKALCMKHQPPCYSNTLVWLRLTADTKYNQSCFPPIALITPSEPQNHNIYPSFEQASNVIIGITTQIEEKKSLFMREFLKSLIK